MKNKISTILALDFDGVICDSLPECYYSSYLSWFPGVEPAIPLGDMDSQNKRYKDFCLWRPYVRSGEDYLLIQSLVDKLPPPTSQDEMDDHLQKAGLDTMKSFKTKIYETRDKILKENPEVWLGLNPLFPQLKPWLDRLSLNPKVWILSTKKPDFILRILEFQGVSWDPGRVLEASGESKQMVMDRNWGVGEPVVFLDDQPDHFMELDTRIDCWLPVWGYVKKDWIEFPGNYKILTQDKLETFINLWV